MPLFRKNIPFKVVKNEQKPKEKAKDTSEPKKEPAPEPAVEKPEWWQEFQALRADWRRALEHIPSGSPNVLRLQQENTERSFYVLQNLGERVETGKTSREMRCLRDDFEVFNIQQTVHYDIRGITNIEVRFEKLDPQKIGLNADKIMALAKEVMGGSTPV
jgi:hypothetical protein